jgi:hypothetical protein
MVTGQRIHGWNLKLHSSPLDGLQILSKHVKYYLILALLTVMTIILI